MALSAARGAFLRQVRWSGWETAFWAAWALAFFVPQANLVLLTHVLIWGLFALSLDLLLGQRGIASLGHAAFYGIGAYVAGFLGKWGWTEPVSGLLLSALAAGLVGLGVGRVLRGLQGVALLMVTLGLNMLLYDAAQRATDITGGDDGLLGDADGAWMAVVAAQLRELVGARGGARFGFVDPCQFVALRSVDKVHSVGVLDRNFVVNRSQTVAKPSIDFGFRRPQATDGKSARFCVCEVTHHQLTQQATAAMCWPHRDMGQPCNWQRAAGHCHGEIKRSRSRNNVFAIKGRPRLRTIDQRPEPRTAAWIIVGVAAKNTHKRTAKIGNLVVVNRANRRSHKRIVPYFAAEVTRVQTQTVASRYDLPSHRQRGNADATVLQFFHAPFFATHPCCGCTCSWHLDGRCHWLRLADGRLSSHRRPAVHPIQILPLLRYPACWRLDRCACRRRRRRRSPAVADRARHIRTHGALGRAQS